ncbi:MAG TPA: polysaccharide deacetylase family protein [Thermomicrobiales bacterium]|nr:polysaccharide deacetylase family protein [Thermomicrobiales bacterium]
MTSRFYAQLGKYRQRRAIALGGPVMLLTVLIVSQMLLHWAPLHNGSARQPRLPGAISVLAENPEATSADMGTPIPRVGAAIRSATPPAIATAFHQPCAAKAIKNAKHSPFHQTEFLVVVGSLNLRAGPGTDCPVTANLEFGQTAVAIGPKINRDGHIWQHVRTPLGKGFAAVLGLQQRPGPAHRPIHIPILMYHHISESTAARFSVTVDMLKRQVKWLRDHDYVSITPIDLYRSVSYGQPLPAKPVMLTIDDGSRSDLKFKRVLDEFGMRGTYFWPNYAALTPHEMQTIAASGEVCGHTVTHPDLSTLSYAGQKQEVLGNKTWLHQVTGLPILCFAYPFGAYNDVTDEVMAESGYLIAFDAWGAIAPIDGLDTLHVARKEIDGDLTMKQFIEIMENGYAG